MEKMQQSDTLKILSDLIDEPNITPVQKKNRTKALELFRNILDRTEVLETDGPAGKIISTVFLPEGFESLKQVPKDIPVIHFSPGGSKNQVSLWEVAKLLSDEGIVVVVSDYRGKGFSSGELVDATVDDFRDDVLAVLEKHLKDNTIIIAGHSLGGGVIKRVITEVIEKDLSYNIIGILNHASSELNPVREFIFNLPHLGKQLLPALINKLSNPIPAFVGKDPPIKYTKKQLQDLEDAMASQESLGITGGMGDPIYPDPEATEDYLKVHENLVAVVVQVDFDQIFPYEDQVLNILGLLKIRRPGTMSRVRAYRNSGIPVIELQEHEGTHSAISLYAESVLPVLKEAYERIRNFNPSKLEQ